MKEYIDKNVYEINKGIKPDVDKHVGTGLYPCEIGGDVKALDVGLVEKIKSFLDRSDTQRTNGMGKRPKPNIKLSRTS